jgi:hypothetical protein
VSYSDEKLFRRLETLVVEIENGASSRKQAKTLLKIAAETIRNYADIRYRHDRRPASGQDSREKLKQ